MQPLTAKQAKFVAEYLVDGNGARAAAAAGYGRAGAKVTAHRLTHANQAVQAEIRARQGVDRQRLQIGRQGVIAGFMEAVEQAREQANPAAMIAGWREIGRMLGLYEPDRCRVEVSAAVDAERGRLETLSNSELLTMINATP